MNRRFGSPPRRDQHYRPRPGVYAVILHPAGVLLTHQQDPEPEWQLPGGGIDPGEAPLPALHREVYEETGWTIAQPRRLGMYRRFTYMPEYDLWAEKLCVIYAARAARRLGPPTEAGHTACIARPAQALALLDNEGDRSFAARLLAGRIRG